MGYCNFLVPLPEDTLLFYLSSHHELVFHIHNVCLECMHLGGPN